jgi:kynurenine formamidase
MTEFSNWGRWGADDELGAMNLITPRTRKAAFALVRDGVGVSLSHDYPRDARNDNTSPFMHQMFGVGSPMPFVSDRYAFTYHGANMSHFDALCHMAWKGKMYNDIPRSEVTATGCHKLDVNDIKQGIAVRAVLMDIPRLKGVDHLEAGTRIYTEDLIAWEKKAHVKVRPGDLLLIRGGRWLQANPLQTTGGAGLHVSAMPWVKSKDVALVGSDYATDVVPSGIPEVQLPNHQLLLVAMGVRLFDNLDLEAVAAEAARRKRWEFLVVAAPLAVEGGTGSPINAIAYF